MFFRKKGPEKLKKTPYDLVSYITIETEAIQDANDKQILSSYTLGKLETVKWYIQLLEVGSEKYIVPHSQTELENIKVQLEACHKQIMQTPISKSSRPLFDINYPKGYEG